MKQIIILLFSATICLGQANGFRPYYSSKAMVVSADKYATDVGLGVLKKGGNAIDAAVAVGFTLAVTYPYAGNIGGGGFLVFRGKDGSVYTLDFREKAPRAAFRDMYLDDDGNVSGNESLLGYKAAGVPGSVDGLWRMHQRFGSMPWNELVAPAIAFAENGHVLDRFNARSLQSRADDFEKFPGSRVFLKETGHWQAGDILRQTDLAEVLRRIALNGREGFYEGETAALIAADMKKNGGLITEKDLADYRSEWRNPVHFDYRGFDIYSMGPPSSGGVSLAGILNTLEGYNLDSLEQNSANLMHLWIEAERQVYADRALFLGDPDFVDNPVEQLISDAYGAKIRADINRTKARRSADISALEEWVREGSETTHFSIVDEKGNAVSITTTINSAFGSKAVVEGCGFLLNNEMDDFSAKPGQPNQYGLLGSQANSIQPGKRMLSAMTPTIVCRDSSLVMVLGSPGGPRIITSVAQVISNVLDHNFNIREAVEAARFHHQWRPDTVFVEEGRFLPETIEALKKRGHIPVERSAMGNVQAILKTDQGSLEGWSDPRRNGTASGY